MNDLWELVLGGVIGCVVVGIILITVDAVEFWRAKAKLRSLTEKAESLSDSIRWLSRQRMQIIDQAADAIDDSVIQPLLRIAQNTPTCPSCGKHMAPAGGIIGDDGAVTARQYACWECGIRIQEED